MHCKNETVTSPKTYIAKQATPIFDTINGVRIISHKTTTDNIQFFLKHPSDYFYNNIGNLLNYLNARGDTLLFAMNGGMYLEDYYPQGLYIENGSRYEVLNTKQSDYGNFYLQPNGVFYINYKGDAHIIKTQKFKDSLEHRYATQSGPLLLIDGHMHPAFTQDSKHIHIRNGVGLLPNGELLFAKSKDSINFYDFATYFKNKGCKNALYLDGAISKIYLPSKGTKELGGRFGVIIAEVRNKKSGG